MKYLDEIELSFFFSFFVFKNKTGPGKSHVYSHLTPEKNPVHVNDFQATLLHLFGLDHEKLTYNHAGTQRRLTSITRKSRVIKDILT